LVPGEVEGGGGDLVGAAGAAERGRRCGLGRCGLVAVRECGPQFVAAGGRDRARGEGVDPNAAAGQFGAQVRARLRMAALVAA
jgi:hypothetical protein